MSSPRGLQTNAQTGRPGRRKVRIHMRASPEDLARDLRREARDGLSAKQKWVSSKWFYDKRGSELFAEITRLPEYYPTRCERQILQAESHSIAAATRAETMIELGCGTSEKTHLLLDAFTRSGSLLKFVPFDVDEATLREAAGTLMERYPHLEVEGIVGDFERHLNALSDGERTLIAFLGSTIGNLVEGKRRAFLSGLSRSLKPGDGFLLGADLVK
ncbi:MAG: L-histidine N(alpha)-methyltransferase, partial [Actinomycetota bacterium]|nr:L-histidine N(alpha)-methyltransferase [Actinomycetota bacterium]